MGGERINYPPIGTPTTPNFPTARPNPPQKPPSPPAPPTGSASPPTSSVVVSNPVVVNNLNAQISYSNMKVGYFKIDLYNTKPNLYGEAVEKWYYPPIEIKCLLERGIVSNVDTEYGVDVNQTLTITVSKTEFETTYKFTPEVGDIVSDQEKYYEISSIDRQITTLPGASTNASVTAGSTPGQVVLYVLSAYLTRTSKLNIVKYSM
jgi:hypothetical protein